MILEATLSSYILYDDGSCYYVFINLRPHYGLYEDFNECIWYFKDSNLYIIRNPFITYGYTRKISIVHTVVLGKLPYFYLYLRNYKHYPSSSLRETVDSLRRFNDKMYYHEDEEIYYNVVYY